MGTYLKRWRKWLTLFIVLVLAAGAIWLVVHPHPPASYRAVRNGMTIQQVHALLGPSETQYYTTLELPDGQPVANGGIGYEEWESLDATVQVFYDPRTGLVDNKSITSRNVLVSIWTLIRERLGL